MKKNHKFAIATSLIISVVLLPFSVILTAAGLIITGTLAMGIMISESAESLVDRPLLFAYLGEDGRSFVLKNMGNIDALDIHVSIVPANLEYLIERIAADIEEKTNCDQLIGKNRIIVNYTDKTGTRYSKSADLSFNEECDYDPTQPMIPLFR